jgi:hypothetical protein
MKYTPPGSCKRVYPILDLMPNLTLWYSTAKNTVTKVLISSSLLLCGRWTELGSKSLHLLQISKQIKRYMLLFYYFEGKFCECGWGAVLALTFSLLYNSGLSLAIQGVRYQGPHLKTPGFNPEFTILLRDIQLIHVQCSEVQLWKRRFLNIFFYFKWGHYMCGASERLTAFGARTFLVLSQQ